MSKVDDFIKLNTSHHTEMLTGMIICRPEDVRTLIAELVPEGSVVVPVSELQRWQRVFFQTAHPHESPYAKDIEEILKSLSGVEGGE